MARPVQPLDTARLSTAQQAIAQAHAGLVADAGQRVTPADRRWAYVYVQRVLAADDDRARREGRVATGDDVWWADVIELGRVAAEVAGAGHREWHGEGCGPCRLGLAVRRVREAAPHPRVPEPRDSQAGPATAR
jgi:hypothetical protein